MYLILAQGGNGWIQVVIREDATEFKPLIKYGKNMYDPENGLAPTNPRCKRLNEQFTVEAKELYRQAKEIWEQRAKDRPVSSQASTLDSLISKAVAEIAVKDVVNVAKPVIDKYVKDTYGVLPKQIEVKTPTNRNVITGVVHEQFETVLKLVNSDIPVFLSGPAGCGKNVICKQVAESLGMEFYFSNAVTQEYKLTGFIDANGRFHETQFYKAFTNGGLFMLDEIDASTPEVLVILNAAIANRYFDFPTGRVNAHESFRVVAAGNTFGTGADIEYSGRYQLDAASLDRFAIVEIDYSRAIEEAIANGNSELVDFIHDFRKTVKEAGIKFIVSYRAVERLSKLEEVFSKAEAIQIGLVKGLDKEDVRMVWDKLPNSSYKKAYAEAA